MIERSSSPLARVAVAFTIILAILGAFLYRVTTTGQVEPWLVLLVSVLGLAAGTAVLGSEAMAVGADVYRHLRR